MKLESLSSRLLAASGLLLPAFLLVAALGLDASFRRALGAAELEQLKLQSYLLLGAAELEAEGLVLPDVLTEPRYGQEGSGLYARFEERSGRTVWRSHSAKWLPMPGPAAPLAAGQSEFGESSAGETPLFSYRYGLVWEAPDGQERPFVLTVWHDQASYRAQLRAYRASLLRWLGLATLLLVGFQLFVLRFGLRPLRSLAAELQKVEAGERTRLQGTYPSEVRGLTEDLNRLLASEQGRRERYRNTLADLAHSLKTPLAVLRGSLESDENPERLRDHCEEQLSRMEQIVAHQLSRAASSGVRPLGHEIVLSALVERLVTALAKVYADKELRLESELSPDLRYRGDEGDLMEILGNLLDNAYKHARKRVRIIARQSEGALEITVADDGPGIAPEERSHILRRGARVDLAAPGQGIGLAVVRELTAAYGGEIQIRRSDLGGAEFELRLP